MTAPLELMITTSATRGWSSSTSMCLIVAVCSGGAETAASRSVTCERLSVVVRIAVSTSRRMLDSSRSNRLPGPGRGPSLRSRSTYCR